VGAAVTAHGQPGNEKDGHGGAQGC